MFCDYKTTAEYLLASYHLLLHNLHTMEHCPIELWLKIAAFACTDGGYTGRSLSLVSRTMRDVVKPVRFQTVSLSSEEQLLAFSRLLAHPILLPAIRHILASSSLLPHGNPPPVIRHLFVSVKIPSWGPDRMLPQRIAELVSAFRAVINVAATNVETLVVHESRRFDPIGGDWVFPALRDLSVNVLYLDSGADHHTRFPSLRRLHYSSVRSPNTRDLWPQLVSFAPDITHLRLSGVLGDIFLPRVLRLLLDVPAEKRSGATSDAAASHAPDPANGNNTPAAALRLPSLKHIYVQPSGWHNDDRTSMGALMHNAMETALQSIADACDRGEGVGKLYVLPESQGYHVSEARKHWLELIEGGDGPWHAETVEHRKEVDQ